MTTGRFNRKPEKPKYPKSSKESFLKLQKFLYSDDEFIKDLLVTNAVLERLLLKYLEKNMELEKFLEKRNEPFFYFNKN